MVNKFKQRIGSRAQVMHGNAKMTGGGLTKKQLKYNKQGKIVSRKASRSAKKSKNLINAGYITNKGKFGLFNISGGNNINEYNGISNMFYNADKSRVEEQRQLIYNQPLIMMNSLIKTPWLYYINENGERNKTKGSMVTWSEEFKNKYLFRILSEDIDNKRNYEINKKRKPTPNSLKIYNSHYLNIIRINSKHIFNLLKRGLYENILQNLIKLNISFKLSSSVEIKKLKYDSIPVIDNIIKRLYTDNKQDYEPKTNKIGERILDCIYIWTTSAYKIIINIYRQLYFKGNNNKLNTLIKDINILTIESIITEYINLNIPYQETNWNKKKQINNNLFKYQYDMPKNSYSNIEILIYITSFYDLLKLGKMHIKTINDKLSLLYMHPIQGHHFLQGIYPKDKVIIFRGCGLDTYFKFRKEYNSNIYDKSLTELVLIQSIESYTGNIETALNFAEYSKKQINSINNIANINKNNHKQLFTPIGTGILELNIIKTNVPLIHLGNNSKYSEDEFLLPPYTPKAIIGKIKIGRETKIKQAFDTYNLSENDYINISNGLVLITMIG